MLSRSTNLCEVRIVIAPDSFTGTLTAAQAALAIKTGWEKTTKADFFLAPMSDGGLGLLMPSNLALAEIKVIIK